MYDEIINKIDEEIAMRNEIIKNSHGMELDTRATIGGLQIAKQLILSSQKPLTIGDKIRESNESLAEFIDSIVSVCSTRNVCDKCPLNEVCGDGVETIKLLNQPSTGTP